MPVLYLDPYKDDPYGKLRGDKAEEYFKFEFSEAKIYSVDNGYYLAAYVTSFSGILRSFKPELPIDAGLCAIPIYDSEYEIRQKIMGNWQGVKHQPSVFEKALAKYIKDNEDTLIGDNVVLKGKITHIPNGMCAGSTEEALTVLISNNVELGAATASGILKPYSPPSNFSQRKGGGSYSRGESSEEKLTFLKKELAGEIASPAFTESSRLGELVKQFGIENVDDPDYAQTYFDVLTAVVR